MICGLLASTAVAGLGYFGATLAEQRDGHRVGQAQAEAHKFMEAAQAAYRDSAATHNKVVLYRTLAAVAGFSSFLFFVLGVGFGGWALMGFAGTLPN